MLSYSDLRYRFNFYYNCISGHKKHQPDFDTIFGQLNAPLSRMLITFYCFAKDYSVNQTIIESELTKPTVIIIFSLLHRCCQQYAKLTSDCKIGGTNVSIQIDETHISKRKYHRERELCHFWLVGGISEQTNDNFIVPTIERTGKILEEIIRNHVAIGSIIKMDCWAGYNWLDQNTDFLHLKVNHKKNFVNPVDKTNTQKIERLWLEIKEMKHKRRGLDIDHLEDYIQEFIWRRNVLAKSPKKFCTVLELAKLFQE
jgi:hypothetical protein